MLTLKLFWEFFKTGLFSVGGGLATLPFLRDMSLRTGWFSAEDIANMVAVSESTPGPIGVNMATYVGYKTLGIWGSLVPALGLVCPSIIIIVIIAGFLHKFRDSPTVKKVFYGLRPASTGLILAAGLGVAQIALLTAAGQSGLPKSLDAFNWPCIALAVALYALVRKKLHPIIVIVIAAAVGIVFKL